MADPFQPKFVDLVRNFTTTTGTGNLVLGEAAPGFTSFTAALLPGDSFYYTVIGLEKATESEVGRGILQADGSIAREAIGGTLTDLSQGRKSVALVAAAEWFDSIEAVRGAAPAAASRDVLADIAQRGVALLTEAGREGLFLYDGSNLSQQVSADSARGIHVAPSSDPSGASGAWVRKFDGPVRPEWFGVVEGDGAGANAAANDAAIAAMLNCLAELAVNMNSTTTQGLYPIQFGLGTYEFSKPIDLINGTTAIAGYGAGHGSSNKTSGPTRLKFYNCTGIRVQGIDTSGASTRDGVSHVGATRTLIRDLDLEGSFAGVEAEHHGIHARAGVTVENVNIRNFAGDGRFVEADTNGVGGNANSSIFTGGDVWSCRNGHRHSGNNTNACVIIGGRYSQNRQWGIWDGSTIGNYYFGIHTTLNGDVSANDGVNIGASVVSHGGNWYFVIAGEEAGASINAPSGTTADNSYWAYLKAGEPEPGKPAWFSGILVRAGGSLYDDNESAQSTYNGYAEQNQGKSQISQRSLVMGGIFSAWCFQNPAVNKGTAVIRSANDGVLDLAPAVQVQSGTVKVVLGCSRGNSANRAFESYEPTYAPNGHTWMYPNIGSVTVGDLLVTYDHSTANANTAFHVTGPLTPNQFGRSSAQPHSVYIPRLFVGSSVTNGRQITVDTAAPTSGTWGRGDRIYNRNPSAGSALGWICMTSGDPGTWSPLFGLQQLEAAGSGLTVSDTDKLLGRSSAGDGAVEEISCTAAGRALLDDADAAEQRTTLGLKRGLSFHCSGFPADAEVIGGGIAPYSMAILSQNSACKALAPATASTIFVIKKNGAQIGQIDFAAAATAGSLSFTDTSIAAGDQITIHNAATADATLADIDGLLAE